MEVELKRPSKIKVKIDDVVYEVSKLNLKQAQEISRKVRELRKAEGDQEGAAMQSLRDMIIGRGIPEDVVDSLELELIFQLVEVLQPSKKN